MKVYDLTKAPVEKKHDNRIRNTRQYIGAVIRSNFGKKQIERNNPFALAFERALSQ